MFIMSLILTADHITYSSPKLRNEHTNLRLWAIQKQYPTNEAEYQAASAHALYWFYSNTLGCSYNAVVQRKVNTIDLPIKKLESGVVII